MVKKRATMPNKKGGARSTARGHGSQRARTGTVATVANVMVADVVTIESSASLAAAARAMKAANVGMLPVVDAGRVRGVITDRDIVVRGVAESVDVLITRVRECLSDDVIAARPDWTTDQAMKAMAEAQVGRLPVLDANDQLVGVVTLSSMAHRAPDKSEALETAQKVSRRSARESAA